MPDNNEMDAVAFDARIMHAFNDAFVDAEVLRRRLAAISAAAAELAWLGAPASDFEFNRIGGKYRRFTNGIMYWYSHDDGKNAWGAVPRGGVYELWTKTGWEYGPFGYPVGLPESSGNKKVCRFEGGTITAVRRTNASVMFWNTALICMDVAGVPQNRAHLEVEILGQTVTVVDKTIYTGRGRAAQLKAVIKTVLEHKPNVVVLAEMMGNSEREKVKAAVKDIYPYSFEGPDERDVEEDGGLLILSQHLLKDQRSTIFRSCCSDDCFANKGALMVRVAPSDGPEFHVVATHLQNGNFSCSFPTNAGVGSRATGKREAQLRHLDSWILGVRDRDLPVIIVGDFNVDANTPEGRKTLFDNLGDETEPGNLGIEAVNKDEFSRPQDLWREYQMWEPEQITDWRGLVPNHNKHAPGITLDKESTYSPGKAALPLSARRTKGERVDLALIDQGERVTGHVAVIGGMDLLWPELAPGIDVSDHYAIRVVVTLSTLTHKLDREVRGTRAWLKYIHALQLTKGAGVPYLSRIDPDEVDVYGHVYKGKTPIPDRGEIYHGRPHVKDRRESAPIEYNPRPMKQGQRHKYSYKPEKTLSFRGSDDVHLEITLDEVGFGDGSDLIGLDHDVIVPKSSQQLHALHGWRYAPNVMYGNDSEYVAILHVDASLEPFTHRREEEVP